MLISAVPNDTEGHVRKGGIFSPALFFPVILTRSMKAHWNDAPEIFSYIWL